MSDTLALAALGILLLVLLDLLCAAATRALDALSLLSLSRQMEAGKARSLHDPRSRQRIALHLARIMALLGAGIGTVSLGQQLGWPWPGWAAFALLTAGVILLGEQVLALTVANAFPEATLRATQPLVRVLSFLLFPLAAPLALLGARVAPGERNGEEKDEDELEDELQAYIDVGEAEGILEGEEGELIQQIVSFGDTIVREVMTPRTEMAAVAADLSLEEARRLFVDSRHSRLPVYRGSLDDIVGVLNVRDLLEVYPSSGRTIPLTRLMRPVHLVPETRQVADLLRDLQRERMPLAVVVDEYGGTAGLVTIEDLLEEIVGEIKDEHEIEEDITPTQDGGWLVNGLCSVGDLEAVADEELDRGEYDSVGGLVFSHLGRLPEEGEKVRVGSLEMQVLQVSRRRVSRLKVHRLPVGDDEDRR
jgi:CBS domain containing-hemolysin-like protein